MADMVTMLNSANRQLHADKAVIERRAEMAAQCECLAAWDTTRACVCNKDFEMPLSVAKLREADALVKHIEEIDANIKRTSELGGSVVQCIGSESNPWHLMAHNGHFRSEKPLVNFTIPSGLVLAALHDERMRLLAALAGTGIISVNMPNLKAVPK